MPNTFIFNPNPLEIPAEPFVVNGYYPLYFTAQAAINQSPVGAFHEHELDGITYYMPDEIQPPPANNQYHGDYPGLGNLATPYDLQIADRNNKNIAEIDQFKDQFVVYSLQQQSPTVTQEVLDDIVDPFFDFFVEEDIPVTPSPNDLFIVAGGDLTNVVSLDLLDVHDQYISRGPQNLSAGDNQISNVFCVYYISHGQALPIPNYKTLEVMLVERGLTYNAIEVATQADFELYDLSIDGQISDDNILSSYDEFIQKMTLDRSAEWNISIRFRSGYRPLAPFVRDPGDYIRPIQSGATFDILTSLTPEQRYFEKVFQQQTFRERIRERFEGQMVILDWPDGTAGWQDEVVANFNLVQVDDLVNNLRMMVHGHWKQVTDTFVIKKFAYQNNYDISRYGQVAPDPANGVIGADGRYGETGLINILADNGGITVIRSLTPEGTPNPSLSDTSQELEPAWNAFPHILTADSGTDIGDDGIAGLDLTEYNSYIDFESNGYDMFNVPELQPYEPPGSIKYYPENRFIALTLQSAQQTQITGVTDQILDYIPSIAARLESLITAYDSTPQSLVNYVDQKLGSAGPLYNVFMANDSFKVKRKKNNGNIVNISSYGNFFRSYGDQNNVRDKLTNNQKDNLLSNYQWGLIFDRDNQTQITGTSVSNLLETTVNSAIQQFIADLNDLSVNNLPGYGPVINPTLIPSFNFSALNTSSGGRVLYNIPSDIQDYINEGGALEPSNYLDDSTYNCNDKTIRRALKQNNYLRTIIFNQVKTDYSNIRQSADKLDQYLDYIRTLLTNLENILQFIDNTVRDANDPSIAQEMLSTVIALDNFINNLQSTGTGIGIIYLPLTIIQATDDLLSNELKKQYNSIQYVRRKVFENTSGKSYFIKWANSSREVLLQNVRNSNTLTFDNYIYT